MVPLNAPEVDSISAHQSPVDCRVDAVRILRNCGRLLDERVPDQQREVFDLRYIENCSMREIADVTGKSPQAVKISLFRTRRTLADHNHNLHAVLSA